ncbi:MAG: c-type cytochrome, partial [Planctomycetes bacterium]|nr:c-type cytochrome [Planctomycetota bacterium]
HASGGSNGGQIAPAGVGISGRDFRFRPGGEFEPLSGGGQFGCSCDDFGRRFVCSNANSARHVVIDDAVLRHNPYYAVPSVTASIAAEGDAGTIYRTSPQEPWRELRTRLRKEGKVRGQVEGVTTFTAATGIFAHKGRLYVGDVSHNLISRKSVAPNGSSFRAERIDQESEFLTSTDNWFRPANFATGPDGALYVCDMYREVIEHPHSLPDFIKKHLDLTSGKDRGRIWRIIEEDGPKWTKPRLGSREELAAALGRPEAWHRQTASRLLYQRQEKSAQPLIEPLLKAERPEVRVAALSALDGLGIRRGEDLLKDPSPEVRENAVRLSKVESLFDVSDDAPRVKFLLACRLAESQDPRAKAAVEKLKPGADRWLQTVIAIASGEKSAAKKIQESKTEAPVQVGDRKKVVESYRSVLALKGDALRGREVYRKTCIGCHRSATEGKDVGPDLSTVKQKTPEELLVAILDPNREVNPQFVAVRIKTTSDQVLDGLIAAENATSVTLKRQEGLVDTILKVNIDKMIRSTLSLMPEGLEKTFDAQQLADLIQFIKE